MIEKFFVDAMAIKFCFLKTFVFFQLLYAAKYDTSSQ